MTLPGGRRLGYAEYGHRDGQPMLFFHGLPGSRRQGRGLDRAAERLGVRLIALDWPGMGLSDFAAGRRLLDWPGDVTAIADAIGLDRFAVMGVSAGGPYAASCAHAIPERLTGVGIISGTAPLDRGKQSLDGLTTGRQRKQRGGMLMLRRLPILSRLVARQMTHQTTRPRGGVALARESLGPVDQDYLDRNPQLTDGVETSTQQAFRAGGKGVAWDMRLAVSDWGFTPAQLSIPVHLWHGELDENVPVADGHRLATAIPDCRPIFSPADGHLYFLAHAEEVLATLATMDPQGRDEPTETALLWPLRHDAYECPAPGVDPVLGYRVDTGAMRTSELANRAGVNVQTLRYYERRGLLDEPPRSGSGYRAYPTDAVRVVRFVKRAQDLGFCLDEIAELLALAGGGPHACDSARTLAESRMAGIDAKIDDLRRMRDSLQRLVTTCTRSHAERECPLLDAIDTAAAPGSDTETRA